MTDAETEQMPPDQSPAVTDDEQTPDQPPAVTDAETEQMPPEQLPGVTDAGQTPEQLPAEPESQRFWAGWPIYACPRCSYETLDEPRLAEHILLVHDYPERLVAETTGPGEIRTTEQSPTVPNPQRFWAGWPIYPCPRCTYETLDEPRVAEHIWIVHEYPDLLAAETAETGEMRTPERRRRRSE